MKVKVMWFSMQRCAVLGMLRKKAEAVAVRIHANFYSRLSQNDRDHRLTSSRKLGEIRGKYTQRQADCSTLQDSHSRVSSPCPACDPTWPRSGPRSPLPWPSRTSRPRCVSRQDSMHEAVMRWAREMAMETDDTLCVAGRREAQ